MDVLIASPIRLPGPISAFVGARRGSVIVPQSKLQKT